jgi:hypothetical protein
MTKHKLNLDIMGDILIFFCKFLDLSYRSNKGFAAVNTLVRVLKVACTPALAIEIVCYYIAS